jgi:phosphopantothenoylcysteine decarboxylase/phosphopantothenate--cysteine ligase
VSPRVVLGVAGGIAAYKACSLLRLLTESGCDVTVVPTRAALEFVGAPTWAALSGKPVSTSVWDNVHQVPHVRLGQEADLVIVAPATADLLARAAHGLADDLLTNVLLTARCPVVMAPAMHTEMWQHPATQANVELLRSRGVTVVEPAYGRLTGADSGPGRLPEPEVLAEIAAGLLAGTGVSAHSGRDLDGRTVVVSAGGTREPLDPVRFLGNRSTGKQGWALAEAARDRGARVILVAANVAMSDPSGIQTIRVETADEMQQAIAAALPSADAVVMAAAVADFRPVAVADTKIKKDDSGSVPTPIALERTPDILAGLVAGRARSAYPVIVGRSRIRSRSRSGETGAQGM